MKRFFLLSCSMDAVSAETLAWLGQHSPHGTQAATAISNMAATITSLSATVAELNAKAQAVEANHGASFPTSLAHTHHARLACLHVC